MRIFIDVGGHLGQTVEAVLDPGYGFDRIYSFEPVHACAERIRQIHDPRLTVVEAGLANVTSVLKMYGAGTLAGSVFSDAPEAAGLSEECDFLDASMWFGKNVNCNDTVYMKLNCEGSECDILEALLNTGEFSKVTQVMVDFDAAKIPSQRHRVDAVKRRLALEPGKKHSLPEELMYGMGSHFGGIQNWLNKTGARIPGFRVRVSSLCYHLRNICEMKHVPFYKLKILQLLPKVVVEFYYAHIKAY